ncbi:uncharacterized protein M421DRAFT_380029 [Didymella exigua CBS 183.55]|uniref:Uncharacterized protein n=1 Tax=Didymella exigua CBS 183.55 TaxID=1150837 RepID=A0A6A5R2F8_9PLEO|nr:uncharacterized protein M421DRAFT_380029 [Didymella exigua CBS 183.55]KAF1922265.1 hypothetical protein M421DRAFT_380029 [Didymella exigua CBS 183.55]
MHGDSGEMRSCGTAAWSFKVPWVWRIEFGECNACEALRCAYSGRRTLTGDFGNKPWLLCGAHATVIGLRVFHAQLCYGDDMTKRVLISVAIACTIFAWLVIRG